MRGTAVQDQQCKDQEESKSDRISADLEATKKAKAMLLSMEMRPEVSEVHQGIMKLQIMLMNKLQLIKDWVAQQCRTSTTCTT